MRIDSDPRNLVTGGDRFPVDLSLPQVPADESDIDVSILVHDDAVDFDYAASLAGMPPLFGRDEIEALPPLAYEPGLDGETSPVAGLAPAGLDFDALDALPHLRATGGVQPFTLATADTDAVVAASNTFAPFLDPLAFLRGDSLEAPLRPEERRALAQVGHDHLQNTEPDWDSRVPLVGHDDIVSATQLPDTTAYRNVRDGIERARPARMLRI
jgi:hypothetical protein